MCSSDGQRMFEAAAVGSLLAGAPWWPSSASPTICSFWDRRLCWAQPSSSSSTRPWRRGRGRHRQTGPEDERILNSIKFIKMNAWVKPSPTTSTVRTHLSALTWSPWSQPFSVKSLSEASVAVDRFKSLFLLPEVDNIRALPGDPEVAVEMCGASLAWEGGGQSAQPSPRVRTSTRQQQRDKAMACCRVLQEDQGTGSLLPGQGEVALSQEEEEGETRPVLPFCLSPLCPNDFRVPCTSST
ncbi:Multidrug resistance-associated protein 5 [Larimichthys crocea]|uniref:Multidrug resistance-associated protein 5 n=1 Tax=Larimichthys crocea TaxID=215358 RepID=A0A6G0HDW3_LARCR|nr:Multidrug resistance-associated protein 5 [Larimichthys crocea]